MHLIVPVGLPGAGKSIFYHTLNDNCHYIDGDSFSSKSSLYTNIEKSRIFEKTYVDGLFLTETMQKELYDLADGNIIFIYFKPDISTCLYNDKYRNRKLNSINTIKYSTVVDPRTWLPATDHYKCLERTTHKMDYICYLLCKSKYPVILTSDKWCTGGTYGTCWDENGPSELPAYDAPSYEEAFDLDDIIKTFNLPTNFSFKSAISVESTSEADYYGGVAYYDYYVLSLPTAIKKHLNSLGIKNFDLEHIKETYPELLI